MGGVCTRSGNGCGKICKDQKQGSNTIDWENPNDNSTRGLVAREAPGQPANPGGSLLTPRARSRLLPGASAGVPTLCTQKIAAVALLAIAATVVICVLSLPIISLFSGTESTTTTTTSTITMTNTTTSVTTTTITSTTETATSTTATTTLVTTSTRTLSAPAVATTTLPDVNDAQTVAAADLHATTTWGGYAGQTTVQNLFKPTTTMPVISTTTQERTVQLSMTLENLDYNQLMEDEELTVDVKRRVTSAIVSEVGIYGIGEDNVDLELRGGSVLVWATLHTETVTAKVVRRGLNASTTTLAQRLESSVKQVSGIEMVSTGKIQASNIRILLKDEELGESHTNYFFVPLLIGGGCFCVVAMIVACVARRSDKQKQGYNLANGQAFHNGGADDFGAPVNGAQSSTSANSKDQSSDEFMHREFIQTAGDMGFTRDVALATLARANNDTDVALDMLLAEQ